MNRSIHLAALSLLVAALTQCGGATEQAAPPPPPPATAPVAPPTPPPPPPDPVLDTCNARLANARALRDTILSVAAQPTRTAATVLAPYDDLELELANAEAEPSLYRAVHPDAKVRDSAAQCEQQVAKLRTELSLDRQLYDVFAGLDTAGLPADASRVVAKNLEDFRRAGVDKDDKTRARIQQIRDELVEVGQRFDKAIASDVRTILVDKARLAGMPQDWIDARKPQEDGNYAVSTNYTDYIPFMSYADDDAARKELYVAYRLRAWPQNKDHLQRILELRTELAGILGYRNWAAYDTANKMIKTDKAVSEFVAKITAAADKRAKAEGKALLDELKKTDKAAKVVGDWQQAYLLGKVKKARYNFDAQVIRPYLRYDKVKQGLLDLTGKLFGITYKPNKGKPTWHPSVEVYDVYEGDKLYGTIYLDMHPRDQKYKHAAQFVLKNGVLGKQLPEGVLVCNFPDPKEGPMEHKEVETFFHEFGHLVHHTFGGHQRWARFSGVATEHDFVEAPSQIFEEWAMDYDTLAAFATNDKGEVVPKDLVARLQGSDEFGKGLWVRHQMFYAAVSLRLHDQAPLLVDEHKQTIRIDQDKLVQQEQNRHSLYPFVEGTHMQASFGHLNGYSSNYYTYMWSMVIAKDMYSAFLKAGILNPDVARKYRKAILEPGGSKDAADLVADFLGRPYTFKSFEDWLNRKDK